MYLALAMHRQKDADADADADATLESHYRVVEWPPKGKQKRECRDVPDVGATQSLNVIY